MGSTRSESEGVDAQAGNFIFDVLCATSTYIRSRCTVTHNGSVLELSELLKKDHGPRRANADTPGDTNLYKPVAHGYDASYTQTGKTLRYLTHEVLK